MGSREVWRLNTAPRVILDFTFSIASGTNTITQWNYARAIFINRTKGGGRKQSRFGTTAVDPFNAINLISDDNNCGGGGGGWGKFPRLKTKGWNEVGCSIDARAMEMRWATRRIVYRGGEVEMPSFLPVQRLKVSKVSYVSWITKGAQRYESAIPDSAHSSPTFDEHFHLFFFTSPPRFSFSFRLRKAWQLSRKFPLIRIYFISSRLGRKGKFIQNAARSQLLSIQKFFPFANSKNWPLI